MATAAAIAASVGPLVGRRREIDELRTLIAAERLVTLTGAGGSGKTRIALELVASVEGDAVFVPLAAVRDPEHIGAAIAQELGLGGAGDEEALVDNLGSRRLFLCLDNFEHLVEGAPLVGRLLAAAPELRVLATSRTPLHISGEQEFPVQPLAREDAVAFFTARARRFRPDFEPDEAVADICRRLDGLPLALELAAARVKLLSPAQILERLERRLPLLTGGARDVPERHRTLRAAIDWSYQLLTSEERRLFHRLALFPGGCTLEAIEAAASDVQEPLEHLASLVDKSLLRRQDDDLAPRFRMLETLREYALEQLEETGHTHDARSAQGAYFVRLAEQAEAELPGPRYPYWIDVARSELDNIESVVLWALDEEPATALQIISSLGQRLYALAPKRVGSWIERVLSVIDHASPRVRTRVYVHVGNVRSAQRDHAGAAELHSAAVAAAEADHDLVNLARARVLLAAAWGYMGRVDDAKAALDQGVAEARATGNESVLANVLTNVGYAAVGLGDLERGRAALEEAVILCERTNAVRMLSLAQNNLGTLLLDTEPERAAELFRSSLETLISPTDPHRLPAREGLAVSALVIGEAESARRQLLDVAEDARAIGRLGTLHAALTGLVGVASTTGEHATAARIAGAARAFRPDVAVVSYLQRFFDDSRRALGEAEWDRLFAAGRELSVEDVLAIMAAGPEAVEEVRRAFLFTDIVSSTQLLELIGDEAWFDLVSWHDRTLRALFAAHGGEEVDHAGDGFFVAFPGAREAIACAAAIQQSLAAHRQTNGFAPQVRIGVHAADATRAAGGYRGLGVHTAARIAALAGGSEVVASLGTAELAGVAATGPPEAVALKGLAEPVPIVRLAWRDVA